MSNLTESSRTANCQTTTRTLQQLKSSGLHISIDDFGTGYSSLQYLQQLPVDVLKVDRSFVAGLGSSDSDRAIVRAVVQLAEALGLVDGRLELFDEMAAVGEAGQIVAASSLVEVAYE